MTEEEYDFVKCVQAVLTPDLIPRAYQNHPENPMFGHCYGAAEALYHLLAHV